MQTLNLDSARDDAPTFTDFRSDASTLPTAEMRRAIVTSALGDDVYGDDQATIDLEAYAAALVGKESALLVPSDTFGNQLAILTHTKRGNEIIVSHDSHIVQREGGGASFISGVLTHTLRARADTGVMDAQEIEDAVRKGYDLHFPQTALICVEAPTQSGRVPSLAYLRDVRDRARKYDGLAVHLDGARLFSAAAYLNVQPAEIAQFADSVLISVSRGLGAPGGAILCGSRDFVHAARYNRKLLGGGMRQTGTIAGPALVALKAWQTSVAQDRATARLLADLLQKLEYVKVGSQRGTPDDVQTNIVDVWIDSAKVDYDAEDLRKSLWDNHKIAVRAPPRVQGGAALRVYTHRHIGEDQVRAFVAALTEYCTKHAVSDTRPSKRLKGEDI